MPYMHSATASTMTAPAERGTAAELAELTTSALGAVYERHYEQSAKVDENGVEYGSSRPPSPPSTGATTPTLRIGPCPPRLWPFVPPPQYGVVDDYKVFRSSYPQDRNMDFIKSLAIKSILILVESEPSPAYTQWLADYEIKQGRVMIAPNKDSKEGKAASATSMDSICEALLFAMDKRNHPLWIHCNQGRHRTGCVVACLRKIQKVPLEQILEEYAAYANPKARTGDIAFIKSFDPNVVYTFAKKTGFLGGPNPTFNNVSSKPITNIYELAKRLGWEARRDTFAETADTLDSLSAAMSDVSLGDPMDITPVIPSPTSEHRHNIDPRLLSNGGDVHIDFVTGLGVADADQDGIDDVEALALSGELDPTLDHDDVAAALA